MSTFNVVNTVLTTIFNTAWQIFSSLIRFFFGTIHYQAPTWLQWCVRPFLGLRAKLNANPVKTIVVTALLAALIWSAMQAYAWYEARPKPITVKVTLTAPTRTIIEEKLPPNPLFINFDQSVAPIELAGKVIKDGVTITPKISGEWRWAAENLLSFQPAADWPIGVKHRVSISPKALKPKTLLDAADLEFTSPAFVASITSSEFYQDPANPSMKKAVFNLNFSHPVDSSTLEKVITLKMRHAKGSLLSFGSDEIAYVVSYDKLKLNAYIHSAPLNIPKDDSELELTVEYLKAERGGNAFEQFLTQTVKIPGLFSLNINELIPTVVSNNQNEPEQVLVLNATAAVNEKDIASHIKAWILPRNKPNSKPEDLKYAHNWSAQDVTDAILKDAQSLDLAQIPAERDSAEVHSFKYDAPVGSQIYVQIEKGLQSFGGYQLGKTSQHILQVPAYPSEVKILSQGSLLALSGERKVAVLTRDLQGLQMEIGRILPGQLQHLITQTGGSFASPDFGSNLDSDNLTERFEKFIPLQNAPGKANYQALDLSEYLGKSDDKNQDKNVNKRGIFLLHVHGYDPKIKAQTDAAMNGDALQAAPVLPAGAVDSAPAVENPEGYSDKRLILVTDLGLIAKRELDGTQVVYVQSIHTGLPVAGAVVDVIAKNGSVIFTQTTDEAGRVNFAKLDNLKREKTAALYIVKKAGDLSFLPINRYDRNLDYSRFDVGGEVNAVSANSLSAYLFSDRGIYRPGDTMHIGMITKTANWVNSIQGIPLEAEVLDARGLVVKKQTINLGASGFNELTYKTSETAPTGSYTVNLYTVKDGAANQQLGAISVKVQEFTPDRMKVKALFARDATLFAESSEGWLHPKELKANINVQNLFGTPAENRRVTATLTLSPAYPAFSAHKDFVFYDPQRAKEGYSEQLADAKTNAEGVAEFDLNLAKYSKATYRLNLLAQAYDAGGGRSVSAEAGTLITELPYLIGYKADSDLNYVSLAAVRQVNLIAVNNVLQKVAADNLTLNLIERKYVSVLTKQNNGTFKYESRKKEVLVKSAPYALKAVENNLTLATETAGDFAYVIKNKEGLELNRVEYSVAGQGNVSRSLERNAELQLTLDKKDYKPGEEISVSIRAPYIGAGLITIERDKVYAQQWFKVDTEASVQKIKLPANFEGNGYVSVQFVRDPSSDEIFTSPLSYGIAPFATSLAARTNVLKLSSQSLVKPGQVLKMKLEAAKPGRAVVFAVDEGILQVARYQNPDALGHFFAKRQLEVSTSQILDMILPEFQKIMAATAPGGDGNGALGKHLNPFKRKTDKPAVYWSGIVDVSDAKEFSYTVPETFNGKLRLIAVMVNDASIGVTENAATVRGDFVLSPNAPLTVSPGDTFEVSVGVANNVEGSGKDAVVSLQLDADSAFEIVGNPKQSLKISELREGMAIYQVRAKQGLGAKLGSAKLAFTANMESAKLGKKSTKLATNVSVRPATPFMTVLQTGSFKGEKLITTQRETFAEYRSNKASVSPLPLVAAGGLMQYLNNYEHSCTEQLVSQLMPMIVLKKRPELLSNIDKGKKPSFESALNTLRTRQNAEGGFGLWDASVQADEFASVYAVHMLMEARDHANTGEVVPSDMLTKGMNYLQVISASPASDIDSARVRAYAIYLLTREGVVTTPRLASLRATLDSKNIAAKNNVAMLDWKSDLTASYMAASYQLLQQQQLASELITAPIKLLQDNSQKAIYGHYYDDVVRNAQTLYIVSRHFPDKVKALNVAALNNIMTPISAGRYNTLSASYALLGFDAYASVVGNQTIAKMAITAVDKQGKASVLSLPANLVPTVDFAANTSRLKLSGPSGMPLFYAVSEVGFDVKPPTTAISQGIEIIREYTDDKGVVLKTVTMGDEINVRVKVRTIGATSGSKIDDIAIIDLLPGGFEPVLNDVPQQSASNGEGSEAETVATSPILITGWAAQNVDVREDRVVFYGAVDNTISEFSYKIKATNSGQFTVPPAYAESMYNRLLQARSLPAGITITKPK